MNKTKEIKFDVIPANGKDLDQLLKWEEEWDSACLRGAYERGSIIRKIRDSGAYKTQRSEPIDGRLSFETFEEYCDARFGLKQATAYQYMDFCDVVDNLKTSAIAELLPTSESHVRPLLTIGKDREESAKHWPIVWQRVIDKYPKPRAKDVEAEVSLYKQELEKNWIALDEWNALDAQKRAEALKVTTKPGEMVKRNEEDVSVQWAKWSWNPVTGCRHNCPYCYARDIANRFYAQKFEPSIVPSRLAIPQASIVPEQAKRDPSFKNIFTCSMADLFGRWVPDEWILAVFDVVKKSPNWNFLMLTKFPRRLAEFEIPNNAWMGTSIDHQGRVKYAEEAFKQIDCAVKWVSVEPMLTPIEFKEMEIFQWVVMGGASRSSQTPEWIPPFDWVVKLHLQAKEAGCKVFHKRNLLPTNASEMVHEYPWAPEDKKQLPKEFKYWK